MVQTLFDISASAHPMDHHRSHKMPPSSSHQPKLSQKSIPSKDLDLVQPHPHHSSSDFKLKVLIVDDNLLNLRVMKQLLKKKLSQFIDLDVLQTASSGSEALDLIANNQFHLVFLDISMPGISGLEVCRRLRRSDRSSPQLHICAVTTDLAEWQIQHYRSYGMDGVIGKPLKYEDLQFALETCLEAPPITHTYDHMCSQSNPRFYFRRHGAHQPLPPLLAIQPDFSDIPDQCDPWESLSSVTSAAPPPCPICQTESRSIMMFSQDYNDRKFRQQSIVSDTNVSAILTYEDSDRPLSMARPRLEQLNLTPQSLIRERRPSFESFDTSTPGSMTTCSSGPSSVIANDLLSPSYPPGQIEMPHSTSYQRLAAFPTAPIITSTDVGRPHSQRRWDSFSCTFASNPRGFRFPKQEKDVFADGFRAAMNGTKAEQALSEGRQTGRSSRRRSNNDPLSLAIDYETCFIVNDSNYGLARGLRNLTTAPRQKSSQNEDGRKDDERWTQLSDQLPSTQSDGLSTISAVTRQLLTRRSHPVLRRYREEDQVGVELPIVSSPNGIVMRKTMSASGLPTRPSWQLMQLSALNYQSVLKSGGLLDEVLIGLDLEDKKI